MRALLLTAVIFPVPALAQEPIEEPEDSEEPIVVTGARDDYDVAETPQFLSVVDEELIDARNAQTLNETLGYTSGVNTGAFGFDTRFDAFFIRGFPGVYTGVFRDGLRELGSPTGVFKTEPYGLESVVVLKGPASALYGASSAGGLVDLVSKRPENALSGEAELQAGSNNRYQGNFDITGPLDQAGALLFRTTLVLRDAETDIPGYEDDKLFIAPALTVRIGPDTDLTVLGEYSNIATGGSAAFFNEGNRVTDIPTSDPRFNFFDQEQFRIGYDLQHRFGEVFSVRQRARYASIDNDLGYGFVLGIDDGIVSRGSGINIENVDTFVVNTQASADFALGGLTNRLSVGLDYNQVDYVQQQGFGSVPQTGAVPRPEANFTAGQDIEQTGIYVQNETRAGGFLLTLAARHDWIDGDTESPAAGTGRSFVEQRDAEFSGRVGASYETAVGLTPYAVYSTSFAPNVGTLLTGGPAGPTTGELKEVGLKYQPPGRNAIVTAALFEIEQEDGVVFDASSGVNRQVQLDLRSRGFEFEGRADIFEGLNAVFAYAYTDTRIQRGIQGTTGNDLNATPEHLASAWLDYTVRRGSMRGLGLGGGLRYLGESFGNDQNTIVNDERLFVDLVARYDLSGLSEGLGLQLNVTNLFDERYETCAAGYCYRDLGRNIIGSIRYRF